jgi:5,10-methylenetetrahydromethanopterin reductase
MSGRDLKFGVVLQGVDPPREFQEMVSAIEAMGYDHLWITDSSLHAHDVYVYLTLAALASSRLRLGSAVTNPLTRHPAVTANAHASIAALAPGRVILGIGAGDRPLLALGLEAAPLAQLRRTVEVIGALLRGEHADESNEGFTVRDGYLHVPCQDPPPIWMSASGPKTLELSGEIADGTILLAPLMPRTQEWALSRIAAGRARSSRECGHETVAFMYGAVLEDEATAIGRARSIAAWFPQTAPHLAEMAGMDPELITRTRALYQGGEFQEAGAAASLIQDRQVQDIALA